MNLFSHKNGIYTVGKVSYLTKQEAVIASSKTGLPIRWDFNSKEYLAQVKKPRTFTPIPTLYRDRARQIRDSYDYIILAYSGGADSDVILSSFLDNDIRLDEVWTDNQEAMLDKTGFVPSTDINVLNLASEWYLVTKPRLEGIRKTHPYIKIHTSDSCVELMSDTDDLVGLNMGYLAGYNAIKRGMYIHKYVESLKSKYKRVCVMMGIEKCIPYMDLATRQYGFMFSDAPLFYNGDIIEYFYWTPDMPEIVVEQAYKIWDYIKAHPEVLIPILHNKALNPTGWMLDRANSFDYIIKKITYPSWDTNIFQTNKHTIMTAEGNSVHIEKFKKERFYDIWASDRRAVLSQVNIKDHIHKINNAYYEINKCTNTYVLGTF